MSEQTAEQTETRAERRARERNEAEQAAAQATEQASEDATNADDEKAAAKAAAEAAEAEQIAKVQGFTVAESDFRQATTPVRNRNAVQKAMDAVAEQAYADWVKADRPSTWSRMPVITYFLAPEDVADYSKLIRRACDAVVPESYEKDGTTVEPSGVRARFGKQFTLTPKMAEKIGKPEEAGKTVLAWGAVDKRIVQNHDDN